MLQIGRWLRPASSPYDLVVRSGALSHVRVLDLSRVLAGPWASQVLADLGAEVIKVERPGAGDDTRGWGPPWLNDARARETRESAYFASTNRGKRSITLDLAQPEGQAIVRRLAGRADVLLENYKAGALARYGLGYEDLARAQPAARLLLDHRLRPDRAVPRPARLRLPDPGDGRADERHRRAGRRPGRRTAEGRRRGRRPHDRHVRRDRGARGAGAPRRTGGDSTSTSRCSTCRSRCSPTRPRTTSSPAARRGGRQRPPEHRAVPGVRRAGRDLIAGGRQRRPVRALLRGARAARAGARRALRHERRARANTARCSSAAVRARPGRARDAATGSPRSRRRACPAARSTTSPQVFEDPQVRHRGLRVEVPHPRCGTVPVVASPIRLSRDAGPPRARRRSLGEHTREVLVELLGMDEAEVEALRSGGVI